MMMDGSNSMMMVGMGLIGLLVVVDLALAAAALIKCLFTARE